MKIVLIVIGIIVIVAVAIELIGRIVSKNADARFKAMSPDAQRKEQERMYRRQQMA